MQENGPLLPGEFERALELFDILHNSEPTLRVRVLQRIDKGRAIDNEDFRCLTDSEIQQRLSSFMRHVVGQIE